MRWGKDNEETVCKIYVENRAAEDMIVTCSGLHLLAEKSYLGASPDGLVLCSSVDTLCNGCLEIKCPYYIEGCVSVEFAPKTIAEKFGNKFFMRSKVDGSLYLPHDHVYCAQVQGQMAILEVEWCDFVVFSGGEMVVDLILAEVEYWNNLSEKLDGFYVQHEGP